jgi:hypothetical protein
MIGAAMIFVTGALLAANKCPWLGGFCLVVGLLAIMATC